MSDTDNIKGGIMKIFEGRVEDTFKPAPHYAEIAVACRAMDMNIANDDYEKIDTLLESNSVWTRLASDAGSTDFLVDGFLPHGATYNGPLAN
jgi:hypothetical protein